MLFCSEVTPLYSVGLTLRNFYIGSQPKQTSDLIHYEAASTDWSRTKPVVTSSFFNRIQISHQQYSGSMVLNLWITTYVWVTMKFLKGCGARVTQKLQSNLGHIMLLNVCCLAFWSVKHRSHKTFWDVMQQLWPMKVKHFDNHWMMPTYFCL